MLRQNYPCLNEPRECQYPGGLKGIVSNQKRAILDDRNTPLDIVKGEEFDIDGCRVWISNVFIKKGVDESWLRTQLGEDILLYVPALGGLDWLPLTIPEGWRTIHRENLEKPKERKHDTKYTGYVYAKVNYTDEKNFAELCCNAHCYSFSPYDGEFHRVNDPIWNAMKANFRRILTPMTGGMDDRIADYGRLILYLLSRIEMTEDEKEVFGPLLDMAPKAKDLTSLINREVLIQTFVREAKKDPKAYLEWAEDWGNYWFQQK